MTPPPAASVDFEIVLAELETVTVQLLTSDPHELDRLGGLLERRRTAVIEVANRLGGHHETSAEDRARHAWEQGREMEERLRLVRAATRLQLQELYRVNFHLHALATSGSDTPHSSCFDLQA